MKTTIEKVLENLVEELESEVRIFEQIDDEFKDKMFYKDFASISYIAHLNTIARVKEVLFRMNINKGDKDKQLQKNLVKSNLSTIFVYNLKHKQYDTHFFLDRRRG